MKTKLSRRMLPNRAAHASLLMLGAAIVTAPSARAQTDETRNWLDLTFGGSLVNGDEASFRERTGRPTDAYGGVADFHYENDLGRRGIFEVDGRGIYDDDYALSFRISDPGLGYIKAGYEQFNTYYAGNGGYFPRNGLSLRLADNELHVQRGKAFFEAGLTLENKPQARLRYSYDFRDGTKDSTSWGESRRTTGAVDRKLAPAFHNFDEQRHTVSLDVSHTIDPVTFGVGGRLELTDYDNRRYMFRRPGEVGACRVFTHREGIETGLYSVHAFTITDITDQWKLTTGYSYTSLDTDLSGSRAVGGGLDADPGVIAVRAFANRQSRDHGYFGLSGGTRLDQHVGNISAMWRPTDHLTIVPALRIEDQSQNGLADAFDVEVGSTAARLVPTPEHVRNLRTTGFLDITESLEARYTGVTNWVFYARAELLQGEGDLSERETLVEDNTASLIGRSTESSRFTQKYVAGATWYPVRRVNAAAQYYHKRRANDYDHLTELASSNVEPTGPAFTNGNLYPAFITHQAFVTDDVNFRVTVRPLSNLSFITRYDFQYTTIDSEMMRRAEVESSESMAHIITESITWSPTARLYLQASGSYTIDRLTSPANFMVPRVQVSRNDYITATGTVGFALTEKTDLNAGYSYFLADNYDPSIAAFSMPYNLGLEEHTVSATVTHRINKNLQLVGRYAFMTSDDETSGGYNNFDAHMISTTLRWRF